MKRDKIINYENYVVKQGMNTITIHEVFLTPSPNKKKMTSIQLSL